MLDIGEDLEEDRRRWLLDDIIATLMLVTWGNMTTKSWQQHGAQCRGGAGRGKLTWESTQCVKGVRAITEFKVEGHNIEWLSSDMVCEGASGIAFCLMAQ